MATPRHPAPTAPAPQGSIPGLPQTHRKDAVAKTSQGMMETSSLKTLCSFFFKHTLCFYFPHFLPHNREARPNKLQLPITKKNSNSRKTLHIAWVPCNQEAMLVRSRLASGRQEGVRMLAATTLFLKAWEISLFRCFLLLLFLFFKITSLVGRKEVTKLIL